MGHHGGGEQGQHGGGLAAGKGHAVIACRFLGLGQGGGEFMQSGHGHVGAEAFKRLGHGGNGAVRGPAQAISRA